MITQLAEYEFSIEHREGQRHRNAHGISRILCHKCGNDDNNIATCAVNMSFSYSQNNTTRRPLELVNTSDVTLESLIRYQRLDTSHHITVSKHWKKTTRIP